MYVIYIPYMLRSCMCCIPNPPPTQLDYYLVALYSPNQLTQLLTIIILIYMYMNMNMNISEYTNPSLSLSDSDRSPRRPTMWPTVDASLYRPWRPWSRTTAPYTASRRATNYNTYLYRTYSFTIIIHSYIHRGYIHVYIHFSIANSFNS